jgi:hypothetical protein
LGLWVVISGEGPQPLTPFWFDGDPVTGIDASHQGEPATVAATPDAVELLCRSRGNDFSIDMHWQPARGVKTRTRSGRQRGDAMGTVLEVVRQRGGTIGVVIDGIFYAAIQDLDIAVLDQPHFSARSSLRNI